MKKERYYEIKNIEQSLQGISRLKYFTEELSDKERNEYFEYKKFLDLQKFLIGGG